MHSPFPFCMLTPYLPLILTRSTGIIKESEILAYLYVLTRFKFNKIYQKFYDKTI